ncbi:hypothetical protein HMPREF2767_02695 [Nosocomiicoccus sp. HMSC067E10]|uniref:SagB/ThcOx family dehydrogenase n=1 Tax=Nosocomiicoccus sp. HMSC067E10 TaxID=1739271 RepID=UPI0008A4BDD4|nr:SagB/ThcOx family dehydrogenase [Nosocomiicoccus sp. HMSC067E10]OFL47463.1 hypothetical protein HMPREF2767_02695 [Nosocomiicoccus sp. HMSC067E10]
MKRHQYIVDFFHRNTTNYFEQLLFSRGYAYKNSKNITYKKSDLDIKPVFSMCKNNDIIPNIKSSRNFRNDFIMQKDTLFKMLHQSYRFSNNSSLKSPSAGALYPVELYIIINNVESINNGVYLYNREESILHYINSFSDLKQLNVPNNDFVKNSSCIIFMVCNLENIINKYGARGYRLCLLECGHIGQNISIVTNKLNLKSCPIGGYYDSLVKEKLNLKEDFYPLYSYAIGV